MNFSGKYELQSQENFIPFMKAIDIPDELITKWKDTKSVTEIIQTGDHFKVNVTMGSELIVHEFTIGEEMEVLSPSGEQIKTVVTAERNHKLVIKMKDITSVSEVVGDQLIITMTFGAIQYKTISKRIR
ncbi:fatty acid-binding protein 1, liver-like [Hypanus sabinus]|uniref:fatty acid-binding protein 1, liver-like n=1 Tax=Hypanus sabinus TaxID=79690 RepID=UPI0028C409F7|nr:fatty acid-binding protein 1, liver-like [Hypanus sabinus]